MREELHDERDNEPRAEEPLLSEVISEAEALISRYVRREFDDPKSRDRRQSAIVGDEGGTARTDGSNELNRVRGLHARRCSELRGRAQVVVRQVDEPNSTATRQQCLVPFRQWTVTGAVRNDKDFQQGKGRRDDIPLTLIGLAKERENDR